MVICYQGDGVGNSKLRRGVEGFGGGGIEWTQVRYRYERLKMGVAFFFHQRVGLQSADRGVALLQGRKSGGEVFNEL